MSSFKPHKKLHHLIIRNVKSIIRNMIFFVIKMPIVFFGVRGKIQHYLE